MERICSNRKQIPSFYSRTLFRTIYRAAYPERVSIPLSWKVIEKQDQDDVTNNFYWIKGNGYTWQFFRHFRQRRQLCDFMFALLYVKPILERGLLYKERICSQREQILSL